MSLRPKTKGRDEAYMIRNQMWLAVALWGSPTRG